ncbi:MAG TPA: methyltransferase [Ramlibacter sp.]|jgi:methylase of polypeptide subunit release factors|uniref:methyltransferase n=1 Tax=Ramlibacter sp. TaxID=1917967 RepID=UPI002D6AE2B2|nr:methyltransferase [Ramlibacter sp.]HZY17870.1 methyltransferase [Ramlibacter sp.]
MNAPAPAELALTDALLVLGRWLRQTGYHFTTATPATHARVLARDPGRPARDLRDVFGWSRPFPDGLLPDAAMAALRRGGLLDSSRDGLQRSRVRFSSLGGQLFAHSAYPTTDEDAVFFGPDTCRFADLIRAELERQPLRPAARVLDLGCGGGPGGLLAARQSREGGTRLVLADINPRALRFAAANAALAGIEDVALVHSDLFSAVDGTFDLIVSNPPYLNDAAQRTYRHGGGDWGEGLSERIAADGIDRLAPGGRLVLYTGAAIVDGRDPLAEGLAPLLQARGWPWHYRELDPDVFGEELDEPAYARAERIAAVALVVQRPGP